MKLSKECQTIKSANRYQNKLYAHYDYVRLIQAPRFTEAGNYIWEVKVPRGEAQQILRSDAGG
jgi:hypothetical protein